MSLATLYLEKVAGEAIRTRCILPKALVSTYKLPFTFSPPDSTYPSQFSQHVVPMMKWADGQLQEECLPIVLAITEQVDSRERLLGDGSLETRSRILQWMCRFNYEIMPNIATIFLMNIGVVEKERVTHDKCASKVAANAAYLEKHFESHKFLVGEELTIADLYGCTFLLRGLQTFMDADWRAKYPALMQWWERAAYSPVFDGFFKQITVVDKYRF